MSQRTLLPRQSIKPPGRSDSSQKDDDDDMKDASPPPSVTPKKRGPLVTAACSACRKRKVKCDGSKPCCSNCTKRAVPCTYGETSKSERLRVVQEMLKVQREEIDMIKQHIKVLAEEIKDPEKRQNLARVDEEIERIRSKVLELETDVPTRPSDSLTQDLLKEEIIGMDGTDTPVAGPSKASPLDTSPDGSRTNERGIPTDGRVVVFMLSPMIASDANSSSASLFDTATYDIAIRNKHYLRIYQEQTKQNLYTALHYMPPLNFVAHDQDSKPCMIQLLRCRQFLAEGASVEDVLGSEVLDVTCLVMPELRMAHAFTTWIVSYVNAFSGARNLDWAFKLGSIYCMFHLLRWLVLPTAENYARVPNFVKPTPLQLVVPHPFWVDFVILPNTRNEFILNPHAHQLRQWTELFLQTRISWPDPEMASTVQLDQVNNTFHLAPKFEETIRNIENWYLLSWTG